MITLKNLKAVAKEFNSLGLDPEIQYEKVSEEELKKLLIEASDLFYEEEMSAEAKKVVKELKKEPTSSNPKKPTIQIQTVTEKAEESEEEPEEEESEESQEEEPTEKPTKKEKEVTKKTSKSKASQTSKILEYMFSLITEEGEIEKSTLIQKTEKKFPETPLSTIRTLLTDGKNEKYNRFPKLLVEKEREDVKYITVKK